MLSPGTNEPAKDRHLAILGSNVYLSISCRYGTVDFDPDVPIVILPHNGNWDIAIGKYAMACGLLPSNSLAFKAEVSGQFVATEWEGKEDYSELAFEVLRSKDGQVFNTIGKVDAIHSSSNKYIFSDYKPYSGLSFYQLKSIHIDGSLSYSEVLPINLGWQGNLEIHPNPTNGDISLSLHSIYAETAVLTLVNIAGKVLQKEKILLDNGLNNLEWRTDYLPQGMYFVKISSASGTIRVQKFMKR